MKGRDYNKLKNWYKLLHKQISKFILLGELAVFNDIPNIKMAFNVMKCGLFSHSFQVSELCCSLLTKIRNELELG